MESLKRLEKQRRKAAVRGELAFRQMTEAFEEKRECSKLIEEIKRKKNPDGIWLELKLLRAEIMRMVKGCRQVQITSQR